MKVADAAKLLEIKTSTIYALCAAGEIDHLRIGFGRGTIRIESEAVEAYRNRARVKAKPVSKSAAGTPWSGHTFKWIKPI